MKRKRTVVLRSQRLALGLPVVWYRKQRQLRSLQVFLIYFAFSYCHDEAKG